MSRNNRGTVDQHESRNDYLANLGADHCIDYRHGNIATPGQRFDIFFDVFGNRPFRSVKQMLSDRGVYPLEKIREAHVQQETKHTRGKIVIQFG